ncbi:MAG: OmpA family protein [Bacteroidota bacterium]
MKNYIALLFFLLASVAVSAQPLNRPTYAMMVAEAENQLEKKDYYRALEWYDKAYEESKDRELVIIMADLSYMLRDYRYSERYYKRALRPSKKNKNPPEEKRFEYARSLKMNGKYEEALDQFDKFIKKTKDPVRKELAELEKVGCEYAMVVKEDDQATLTHAGKKVNTKISEYSPHLTNDNQTLYYSSLNSNEVIELEEGENDSFAKIYKATRGDKGWSEGEPLGDNINREGYYNTNIRLSADEKRMFFTRAMTSGSILTESKIYMSESSGGAWGAANELSGVNGEFIAKSPAAGELFGKEVLFFVSDMDGGEGGYDIYYATYKGGGQYGDPVNLGPQINTVGNEDTPFYRDGVLYFSSDAHPGIGGYDIFRSDWSGTRWSKPQNMGKPFNSSVDDLYFMLDKEGYHGSLASNRIYEGARSLHSKTCCNDIYNVSLKKIEADLIALAFDSDTQEPLSGVTFEIYEVAETGNKLIESRKNANGNNYDSPLELDKSYMITGYADNYDSDTAYFSTVGLFDSQTFNEKLNLKPGEVYEVLRREEPFVLENILYDFNDDKILPTAEPDLEFIKGLMERYPEMEIELSSHTDARGGDDFNKNLSQRRAESARRWLVKRGIARARIAAVGYGETKPQTVTAKTNEKFPYLPVGQVLVESYIDSLQTDEAQFEAAHQLNRRTEFKIVAGPTSIVIEEEKLIQVGNRKVDENAPKKPEPKKDNNRKPKRRGGGDSVIQLPSIKIPQVDPPVEIHKLSSLYGKKELKGFPIMQFDNRVHEMGEVKKGEVKEHIFHYTNVGDTTLEIDLVQVCECTEKEYTPRIVKPGEKGWIKVIFDSNKAEEDQEESDVDIYLKNIDPEIDAPIFERIKYTFKIVE